MRYLVWMLCVVAWALGEQPAVVLTFDNLPVHTTLLMDCETRTQKYLDALGESKIQTVFFTIGAEVERSNARRMGCIHKLVNQGHLIANHSYSHPHLSAIAVEDYLADVLKCEPWIASFATYRPWFRYPFLDIGLDPIEGASVEKAVACATALKNMGFLHGYVSIDSFDWFINMLMLQAIIEGQKIDLADLESFYLGHLVRTIDRYLTHKSAEERALFSTHVFLFHANDLNALFLPQIITLLRQNGWRIAPPDEIFNNSANRLADFEMFIHFKVWELTSNTVGRFQDPEKITREFNEQVLHIKDKK
jgi:peptidoglycan-N-acetylglucosamine deacetylase